MINVLTDFPGAALQVERVSDNTVFARVRQEAICHADGAVYDYSRHFAFGLENASDDSVLISVFINCQSTQELPSEPALLFSGGNPTEEFRLAQLVSRSDAKKSYAIDVPLGARERVYIANYLFRPFEWLAKKFDAYGQLGRATRLVYGTSVEGRELVAYAYLRAADNGRSRPVLAISSGVHPPEPDTLATEALMEHLAAESGAALRADFDIYIIPLANPDGFVHGYSGCNAEQINFYWLFRIDDPIRCPEAHFLWQLLERVKPVLYFDWHGYTFQRGSRHAAPYVKPVIFHDGAAVRRLVRKMNARVCDVVESRRTTGYLTYAPSTLATRLSTTFNTITYAKFHLELRLGVERNKAIAVESVEAAADALRGIDPRLILKHPAGQVGPDRLAAVGRQLVTWWGGRFRPLLGRLKRRAIVTRSN